MPLRPPQWRKWLSQPAVPSARAKRNPAKVNVLQPLTPRPSAQQPSYQGQGTQAGLRMRRAANLFFRHGQHVLCFIAIPRRPCSPADRQQVSGSVRAPPPIGATVSDPSRCACACACACCCCTAAAIAAWFRLCCACCCACCCCAAAACAAAAGPGPCWGDSERGPPGRGFPPPSYPRRAPASSEPRVSSGARERGGSAPAARSALQISRKAMSTPWPLHCCKCVHGLKHTQQSGVTCANCCPPAAHSFCWEG